MRISCVEKIVVYAIGGNALSSPTVFDKSKTALVLANVLSDVIDLLEAGWQVVLTHGNGPQVGHLMSLDSDQPMDEWVAATQGMIGHTIALNLDSILRRRNRPESTSVVLTRVKVDSEDKAFKYPTKPVGRILTDKQVMEEDWDIAETVNGPRRVVASPKPVEILDINVIKALLSSRSIVICCGGGGIPVIENENQLSGVPAVIDKDHLSSMLAVDLNASALIISTAVDGLKKDFATSMQTDIPSIKSSEAQKLLDVGHFPPGSMGPKVQALIDAVSKDSSMKCIICSPGNALKALRGESGTSVVA
jgi:carbamate kinase